VIGYGVRSASGEGAHSGGAVDRRAGNVQLLPAVHDEYEKAMIFR